MTWAEQHATIISPTEGRQAFSPYPYQRALLEDDSPRRLVLKARQTGLSNAIAIEALWTALNRPDSTILFVSRNQQAAKLLILYCQHTLAGLRDGVLPLNENQSELAFPNGSRIVSLPANPSTGRGFAATAVYLDEFGHSAYDALIYESIIGTVSTGGRVTILSTPNGRANLFFRLWQGLEGGEWSRHRVHWSDCPRYDEAWAERTKAGMPRQSWAQEYECDFISSGEAPFDPSDLALIHDGYIPDQALCEEYVTAWDIGRRQDPSVGGTLGRRGDVWHLIEYERFLGAPYPVVQERIEVRRRKYPGRHRVESNGPGDPVIENLSEPVEAFVTTARSKLQAIQALQLWLQKRQLKVGTDEGGLQCAREMGLYQWADKELVQDSVMMLAIAALTAQEGPIVDMWAELPDEERVEISRY